jgi:putative membrane protein
MKRHLRSFAINLASLWLVSQVLPGMSYGANYQTLLIAAFVLTIVNLIVKPLVNLLLLPINLLTLGAFRWLVNVASLYLVTILVPQFQITSFKFSGFVYQGFVIPPLELSVILVFILASFFISLTTSFLFWLVKK